MNSPKTRVFLQIENWFLKGYSHEGEFLTAKQMAHAMNVNETYIEQVLDECRKGASLKFSDESRAEFLTRKLYSHEIETEHSERLVDQLIQKVMETVLSIDVSGKEGAMLVDSLNSLIGRKESLNKTKLEAIKVVLGDKERATRVYEHLVGNTGAERAITKREVVEILEGVDKSAMKSGSLGLTFESWKSVSNAEIQADLAEDEEEYTEPVKSDEDDDNRFFDE